MEAIGRYWHTIRHLKLVQIYGRVLYRLTRPRPDLRTAPRIRPVRPGTFVSGAERPASMLGPITFRFLNDTRSLLEGGWDDPTVAKLWRYNLHYFDDLNAQGADRRLGWHQALLDRWVRENPPAAGTGWDPYPTSLRLVNWIKWSLRGNALETGCIASLAVQVRWLSRRLETHLLGNHLLANGKALVFAGLYFGGPEADGWLERGMRVLADQVPAQIRSDGGHFELSPMYHALALEDLLDLCNLTIAYRDAVPTRWQRDVAAWSDRAVAMLDWLQAMSHPDGEIAFFNDAAIGIAPSPSALTSYAARLGLRPARTRHERITRLDASGYIRLERGSAVAILDVGPIGSDYMPGHAHADTLSFELSIFGHRVLVNSGVSCYEDSTERRSERGTAAHNTVIVDGADSSEVWAAFRVARRAQTLGLTAAVVGEVATVRCAHDGYRRLPGRVEHQRQWRFEPGALVVIDTLSGRYHTAQARFHLHPDITVRQSLDTTSVTLELPSGHTVAIAATGGQIRQEATDWHPQFGAHVANRCVVVDAAGSELETRITWTTADDRPKPLEDT